MRMLPVAIVIGATTGAAIAAMSEVHQADKKFLPARLAVTRGSVVSFVNDETVVHHAFTDTAGFSADTGDIPPGESRDITFSKTGRFEIRCAIHPQMRMTVDVTDP